VNVNNRGIAVDTLPGMIVNREYRSLLEAVGLSDFDRVYGFQGGETVKEIRERRICRIELSSGNESRVFFLKRHKAERPPIWSGIKGLLLFRNASSGMTEFQNICDFRGAGIATAAPVAAGERRISPLCYESFLITESMEPFVSLERLIQCHPERFEGNGGQADKNLILRAIADLMRVMHDAGLNHLDFNADHLMVGPGEEEDPFRLALLDFQRVDRRKWMKGRWFIKTMAETFYTLPDPVFTETDRRFLFERYHDRPVKSLWDRFALKWVIRKAKRIGRHTEKIIARKNAAPLQ
jgi:hypothetical protein